VYRRWRILSSGYRSHGEEINTDDVIRKWWAIILGVQVDEVSQVTNSKDVPLFTFE
jgi:hypothetical protein